MSVPTPVSHRLMRRALKAFIDENPQLGPHEIHADDIHGLMRSPVSIAAVSQFEKLAHEVIKVNGDLPARVQPPRPKHRRKVAPGTLRRMRNVVYRRDDFTCQHCGYRPDKIPTDWNGYYSIGKLELDHIIPYSRGGLFTYDNLQTLCYHCNGRKGARV